MDTFTMKRLWKQWQKQADIYNAHNAVNRGDARMITRAELELIHFISKAA